MNLSALADLFASHGLRLLPGSYAVPVDLLVQLPDATITRFTARGRTLRLRQYAAGALTAVEIPAECGCGDHHPQTGPTRVTLSAYAAPIAERLIDGELLFGWTRHEAGLLRLADAVPYFFDLLAALPQVLGRIPSLSGGEILPGSRRTPGEGSESGVQAGTRRSLVGVA